MDLEDVKISLRRSKNGHFRIVWLTRRARLTMEALRREQAGGKVVDLRVFLFGDLRRQLKAAGKRSGLPGVHMHQFRHAFATRLRDRGVPLERIKELLGHRTMQILLRYAKGDAGADEGEGGGAGQVRRARLHILPALQVAMQGRERIFLGFDRLLPSTRMRYAHLSTASDLSNPQSKLVVCLTLFLLI